MTVTSPTSAFEVRPTSDRWLPLLLLLFVGSGCAALIYEVVWFQLLQLSIGSSAISLGVLLGIYMGGMCAGSLLFPKLCGRDQHPLRVYAALELGIGACGALALYGVPALGAAYTSIGGSGPTNVVLRAAVVAVCLLPPTLMMGATLPAIARWVRNTPAGMTWLGYFYGGNLAGAVAGSLLAGYYLLRVYDMPTATFVAVALNVAVAIAALAVSRRVPYETDGIVPFAIVAVPGRRMVYVAIALSGLTALGSEVVWTRLLSLLFGGTTYTFSLILAVFLVGLGVGSAIGVELARRVANPPAALATCQLSLCVAMAWAAYMISASLPFWPINPSISTDVWYTFQLDLVRAIWVMLPAAMLWGASFPVALGAVATTDQDPGRIVGGVYAANTVGAILGALITSLGLVGTLGSQVAQQILIGLSALSGLLMLASMVSSEVGPTRRVRMTFAAVIGVAVGTWILVRAVPPLPGILVAYGRYAVSWVGVNDILYVGEGVTASVAVSRTPSGVLNYHNAGKVQASSEPQDMRLQRILGHMTTLMSENPAKVLVIGCGAGVTAGAVSIDPRVKEETIAEIEPLVPLVVSSHFAEHNFDVIRNPKVRVHLDDARHFLLTTTERFDAITSDPLDPWVKGAATLYTREFFDVVKSHLNPGGVVTLFVQLYESSEDAVRSEIATFLDAFPNGVVFANIANGQGYDLVLAGQLHPRPIDVDAVDARLRLAESGPILKSLSEVGIHSAVDLFGTYAGRSADMAGWLRGATINRDRNLRLQYLAGLGLNLYQSDPIFRHMVKESRYPDGVFTGSPDTLQKLRAKINVTLGRQND